MTRRFTSHPREREVFLEVFELNNSDEQRRRLVKLCSNDEHLRIRVKRLLEIQEREGLFEPNSKVRVAVKRLADGESPFSSSS